MSKRFNTKHLGTDFNKHVALTFSQRRLNDQLFQIVGTSAPVLISKHGYKSTRHAVGVVGGIRTINICDQFTVVLSLIGELTVLKNEFLKSDIDYLPSPPMHNPQFEFDQLSCHSIKIATVDSLLVFGLSRCGKIVANIYLYSENDMADTVPGFYLKTHVDTPLSFASDSQLRFLVGSGNGDINLIEHTNFRKEFEAVLNDESPEDFVLQFEDNLVDYEYTKKSVHLSDDPIVRVGFINNNTAYAVDDDDCVYIVDMNESKILMVNRLHNDRISDVIVAGSTVIISDISGVLTAMNSTSITRCNTGSEAVSISLYKDMLSVLKYDGSIINKEFPKDFY